MKTIVVKSGTFKGEYKLDPKLFDDPVYSIYNEAVLCAIDDMKKQTPFKLTVIFQTFEKCNSKNPSKHYVFNSYYVLLASRMYEEANKLRKEFKETFGIDLAGEAVKNP